MIIRPATLSDVDAIIGIAEKQAEQYPLRVDKEKMRAVAIEAISASKHFAYVIENEGVIAGALVGLTSSNLWAQRYNCNIALWVSHVPGAGATILRKFRDWIKTRRAIKVAGFCPDLDFDPRVLHLAERIGFKKSGGAYLLYN